jgi:hypothetical protein
LASDDIFNHILSVRKENRQIKQNKNEVDELYRMEKRTNKAIYPDGKMSI